MGKLEPVVLCSSGEQPVELEGLLHSVDDNGPRPAAVLCHPHPLGGGTMHNPVVRSTAHTLAASGVMALRFNFRGVGRSDGRHDHGQGERADVAGALDWLLAHPDIDPTRVSVVGYSFGAWVGLTVAQTDPRVAAVASIALPAWHYDAQFAQTHSPPDLGTDAWDLEPDLLVSFTRPKLFVAGEYDSFAPPSTLRELLDRVPPPKKLHVVHSSDHFFHNQERKVGEVVSAFVSRL